jgi:uncharacterized protein YyaL (SSP411 family)
VLDDRSYLEAARRAATFIRHRLWDETTGTLLRRYRAGDAGVSAYAEDYAFLVFGLLELFQADGQPAWLEWSLKLQQALDALFWDDAGGGWFSTTGRDASVLLRLKEDYDGAEPAASSVAVLNLLLLSHLGADAAMTTKLERTLGAFATRATQMGRAVPMMLAALSAYHSGVPQIVIAGEDAGAQPLLEVVRQFYLPTALVIRVREEQRDVYARLLPWTASMGPRDGRTAAYICREFACEAPVVTPDAMRASLSSLTGRRR